MQYIISIFAHRHMFNTYLLHFLDLRRLNELGDITWDREHHDDDSKTDEGTSEYLLARKKVLVE